MKFTQAIYCESKKVSAHRIARPREHHDQLIHRRKVIPNTVLLCFASHTGNVNIEVRRPVTVYFAARSVNGTSPAIDRQNAALKQNHHGKNAAALKLPSHAETGSARMQPTRNAQIAVWTTLIAINLQFRLAAAL